MRHRGFAAGSAVCCRSRHGAVLRCSTCANSPLFHWASASVRNQWALRHSSRKRPLNALMNALSVGFPGREVQRRADRPRHRDLARRTRCPDRRGSSPGILLHCFIADPFQYLHDIGAAEGEPRFQRRRETGEDVDDREHPKLAARRQLLMDEVHRPGLVRSRRRLSITRSLALTRRFGVLLRNCRPNSR